LVSYAIDQKRPFFINAKKKTSNNNKTQPITIAWYERARRAWRKFAGQLQACNGAFFTVIAFCIASDFAELRAALRSGYERERMLDEDFDVGACSFS
jgi:hypothetical protein